MAKIISVANQKGGVGKTITTINLGSVLSFVYSKKVLLIDMDAQGNTSDGLNLDVASKPTIYEVMNGENDIKEAIHDYKGIDVITSDIALSSAEREYSSVGSEHKLRKQLEKIKDNYDYIFIDCPPSLGILTINAFTASDELIIPIKPSVFSLKGLIELSKTISSVQEYTNEKLIIRGVLFTEYNERFNINKTMKDSVNQITSIIEAPVFETFTRRSVVVEEALASGKDLINFDKASTTEEDYIALGKEFLEMVGDLNE